MSRRRAFFGLFVAALAWRGWEWLTYDCAGGFSCRHVAPTPPWAAPVVLLPAALLVADLLGRRLLGRGS